LGAPRVRKLLAEPVTVAPFYQPVPSSRLTWTIMRRTLGTTDRTRERSSPWKIRTSEAQAGLSTTTVKHPLRTSAGWQWAATSSPAVAGHALRSAASSTAPSAPSARAASPSEADTLFGSSFAERFIAFSPTGLPPKRPERSCRFQRSVADVEQPRNGQLCWHWACRGEQRLTRGQGRCERAAASRVEL